MGRLTAGAGLQVSLGSAQSARAAQPSVPPTVKPGGHGPPRRAPRTTSYPCATMAKDRTEDTLLPIDSSRSAGRVRRIRRGCARWEQDLRWRAVHVKSVFQLTLTTIEDDPGAAFGRVRHFLRAYRERWHRDDLIWVGETQARGAAHFHLLLVNAPTREQGFSYEWMRREWGPDRIHWKRVFREQFRRQGTRYLTDYFKDKGAKSYQHDYENWPAWVRSLGMQRLKWSGEVLDAHRSRFLSAFVPGVDPKHPFRGAQIALYAVLAHEPNDFCPPQRAGPGSGRAQPAVDGLLEGGSDLREAEPLLHVRFSSAESQLALELSAPYRRLEVT